MRIFRRPWIHPVHVFVQAVLTCLALIGGISIVHAQALSTPLSFEECLTRQRDLRKEAEEAGSNAWQIVTKLENKFSSPDSDALYKHSNELIEQATALKCAWHPDTPKTSDGEQLNQFSGAMRILREALSARQPVLGGYLRDRTREAIEDKMQGNVVIAPASSMQDIVEGNAIRNMVNDRFKELDEHNLALLGVLDKTAAEIAAVGGSNSEANDHYDHVVIDFPAMFNSDSQSADAERQAASKQASSASYTGMHNIDPMQNNPSLAPPVARVTAPTAFVTLTCTRTPQGQACIDPAMGGGDGCGRSATINGVKTTLCGRFSMQFILNQSAPYGVRVPAHR